VMRNPSNRNLLDELCPWEANDFIDDTIDARLSKTEDPNEDGDIDDLSIVDQVTEESMLYFPFRPLGASNCFPTRASFMPASCACKNAE